VKGWATGAGQLTEQRIRVGLVSLNRGRHAGPKRQALAIGSRLSAGDVTVEDGDTFGVPWSRPPGSAAAESGQILAADIVRVLARGRGAATS
jgi:hypothetical protein